jgi:hypothetical protein
MSERHVVVKSGLQWTNAAGINGDQDFVGDAPWGATDFPVFLVFGICRVAPFRDATCGEMK